MNLLSLLTTRPPAVPQGVGYVHRCSDDDDLPVETFPCVKCGGHFGLDGFYLRYGKPRNVCKTCEKLERKFRK